MSRITVEELKIALQSIGWDIKGDYPNRWIYNNFGEQTNFRVLTDHIELDTNPFGRKGKGTVCFYFSDTEIITYKLIRPFDDNNTVTLGSKTSFVRFYNFENQEASDDRADEASD